MQRIVSLFILISFLFSPHLVYSQSANRAVNHYFYNWFEDRRISPYPFVNGYSAGMGQLEFTIRDSTRDAFINPAKYYRGSGSKIIVGPSVTRKSLSVVNERSVNGHDDEGVVQELFTVNNRSGFSTRAIPVGGFFEVGSLYAGGLISFIDYTNTQRIRERSELAGSAELSMNSRDEETVSGSPFQLLAGYYLTDNLTLSVSYKRNSLSQDRENISFDNNITFQSSYEYSSQFFGPALGFKMFGGQSYLMGGIYNNRIENDEISSGDVYWSEVNGFTIHYEHLQPVTSTLAVGGLLIFNQRDFTDRTSERFFEFYDRQFRSFEVGVGVKKTFSSTKLAAEISHHRSTYFLERDQSDTNTDHVNFLKNETDLNYLMIRAGVDIKLLSKLHLQAGVQLMSLVQRNEGEEQLFFPEDNVELNSSIINDPSTQTAETRYTTGLTYSFSNFKLSYSLNIVQAPEDIIRNFRLKNDYYQTQFQNQLTVTYTF